MKFSKYLPEFGYDPIIITVDPEKAEYPIKDHTLEQDVRVGQIVYRTDCSGIYEYYKKLIDTCKIDIFVSGNNINVEDLKDNPIIKELKERKSNYVKQGLGSNENKEKVVEEKMDISQGKLIIGMDLNLKEDNLKFGAQVYNTILGGSASSKLFKNVREKASLAYTVSSNYMKLKSNIFIRAGIEIENYDKTLEIIKEQLKDMEESNFSEEDIMQAKRTILSSINNIEEEQDIELSYYYGQELSDKMMTIEEYKNNIEKVTREEINSVAKSLSINTIYFLRN